MKITPVILSGGSGTRLWPLSRKMYPKQFISLHAELTMLQETVGRLEGLELNNPMVVCNENHRFIVAEQMRQMGIEHPAIILEPEGRNTAPAIALAAHHDLQVNGAESCLLVLAADHIIVNEKAFHQAIAKALQSALENNLVTFGIVPDKAETGYGYIQYDKQSSGSAARVKKFVEKPTIEKANEYIQAGDYLWNSGMFMFTSEQYLSELKTYQPEIAELTKSSMDDVVHDMDFIRINAEIFAQCPSDSIDYAVMEKTQHARVVSLDAGWNDIGSWSSLWEVNEKDTDGNGVLGDVMMFDSHNNLAMSESRLLAAVGVDDLIMVETKDAVLVASKEKSQEVKEIVERLKRENREEANFHRVVFRPWGCFDSIEEGDRYKVKRITVKPGAKLSLQMHHHRAEHWVVVSGTAKVQKGKKEMLLTENESIYINVGETHSLENPGKKILELIEIQTGSYLGEDDIVRFDDKYGRHK